jgi:YVTN family beta-propeller protein
VAAVDLEALAVARHIPIEGAPTEVMTARSRPSVYALTPETGSVHEIQADRLSFARKLSVGSTALSMHLARGEGALYILLREPPALACVALDSFRMDWRLPLPEEPANFAISNDKKTAAVSFGSSVCFVDLATRRLGDPIGSGESGALRFLRPDGRTLIAASRNERLLSLYDVASSRLIAHLPLAVRPDNLCSTRDDGQLFVTGEGMDAVVIVYPYRSEVGRTVLAGHAPGAMAASRSYLFVASPQTGDVSILNVSTQRVIGVVSVGSDPGFIAVTEDDQYALVLNRKSGDMAVLRVDAIAPNRYKERTHALLTVIPVGSRPVSADVRAVT